MGVDETALRGILQRLRDATGVDFTDYKGNTLKRRINRRMVLNRLEQASDYVRLLDDRPGEVEVLYQDILISVTSFFHDPDAFDKLKEIVFPRLLDRAAPREPLRIWVPACSAGQEAYSIAMAYQEFAEGIDNPTPAHIFATDVNAALIETARAGVYSENDLQDLSTERRRRFFTQTNGQYRINKSIREMCVFARHNLLTDPPFSRMDLVSCRNLLIYMTPTLQQKIIPLLHYALRPEGFLMLGGSETIGSFQNLFEVADRQHRIYSRNPGSGVVPSLGEEQPTAAGSAPATARNPQQAADRVLLARYAPAGVLINDDLDILSFHGETAPYLAPAPGKASLNLLKMARQGLPARLRMAIHKARDTQEPVRETGVWVESEDGKREVTPEVLPVTGTAASEAHFWVLFSAPTTPDRPAATQAKPKARKAAKSTQRSADQEIARLRKELDASRDALQATVEQYEAANEELQSTNEELGDRNKDLNRLNDDLDNLFASVDTPIVMVGQDLRIRRFTPAAQAQFKLTPNDVGHPLGDIGLDLGAAGLETLLTAVIDTVETSTRDIQDREGRWYSLRLRPYKTQDNTIDGAVLMLVDVDLLKRAQAHAEAIVETVREPLLVLDGELRVKTANRRFYQMFQTVPDETEGHLLVELGNGQWHIPELRRLLKEVLPEQTTVEDFQVEHEFESLGFKTMRLNARQLMGPADERPRILLAIEDVSDKMRLEKDLQDRVTALADTDRHKNEFLAMLAHELRNPLNALASAAQILNRTDTGEDAAARARDILGSQVDQMARMLDDLLDVSRITQGKIELRKAPMELAPMLKGAAETTRHVIAGQSKELTVSLPSEPLWLNADASRLQEAVGNLLNNAARFTSDGGHIQLTAERAEAGDTGADALAVIRVRDDGIGMTPETLPHVFDLFTQAQTSLDRIQGGLGVGLTLVRQVVERHGGRVEAHSDGVDQGSEFVVRLPVMPAVEADPPADDAAASNTQAPATTFRVLVVDDQAGVAEGLSLALHLDGHEIEIAYDGPAALETAERFQPDAILIDIGLPGMDGYEVARRLRQRQDTSDALLIALSGYGQDEHRRRGIEAGFDYYVTKPADPEKLSALLGNHHAQ